MTGLIAGAGKADITPPLTVGTLLSSLQQCHSPSMDGVRLPLQARALYLQHGESAVALIALDLLGTSMQAFGGRRAFLRAIRQAADLPPHCTCIITSTHTHASPETLGLTPIRRTAAFRAWIPQLATSIGAAIRQARAAARPATPAFGEADGGAWCVYRRVRTRQGIVLAPPFPPDDEIIHRDGPIDPRVGILALNDTTGHPIALLVNAACHPVHEMLSRQFSSDYPGVMATALEAQFPGATALFLNGACGNINAFSVSGGGACADAHGTALAALVRDTVPHLAPMTPSPLVVRHAHVTYRPAPCGDAPQNAHCAPPSPPCGSARPRSSSCRENRSWKLAWPSANTRPYTPSSWWGMPTIIWVTFPPITHSTRVAMKLAPAAGRAWRAAAPTFWCNNHSSCYGKFAKGCKRISS